MIIRVSEVAKRYPNGSSGSLPVLQGVQFAIAEGERVALMGPSGAGKSTLLNLLGGLDTAFEGEVEVLGHRLRQLSDAERAHLRNSRMGFVFQSYHLIPNLVAWRNVALPATFSPARVPDGEARAREALDRVGLSAHADSRPSQLSGGERQRVAIARALFFKPPLLLCDEPTGNLDAVTAGRVVDLFLDLNRRDGVTLVIATHEDRVAQASGRILKVEGGTVREGP